MTTSHTLYWNALRWNFDVKRVDLILRHNVQRFNVNDARFSARVLKRKPRRGVDTDQTWNVAFLGGNSWWNWLQFFWRNPGLQEPGGFPIWALWQHALTVQNSSIEGGETFLILWNYEKSDWVTLQHKHIMQPSHNVSQCTHRTAVRAYMTQAQCGSDGSTK